MATAAPARRRRALRETVAQPDVVRSVDAAAGVICGVKILGRRSVNGHGEPGAKRTEYTLDAMEKALPLYEGVVVNADHPDRAAPHKDRSSLDRLGVLKNVRVTESGIFGDLHLIRSHPLSARLLEAAQSDDLQSCYALSHNAFGRGDVVDGTYVIREIPEVRSVDLVADGGTNRSLFESRKHPVKRPLRDVLESAGPLVRDRLARILEDDGFGGMEVTEAPEGSGADDHLCSLVSEIIKDTSKTMAEKRSLIARALSLTDSHADSVEESDENDDESDAAGSTDKDDADGDMEGAEDRKPAKEGRKPGRAPKGARALRERCERLCRLADVEPAAALLESLCQLPTVAAAEKHLSFLKGVLGRAGGSPPRSAPPASRPVREAAAPSTPDGQLAWLRS